MTQSSDVLNINYAVIQKIMMIVNNRTTLSREGSAYGASILPAEVIFDELRKMQKLTRTDFAKCLLDMKMVCMPIYRRIEIPKEWDGDSQKIYPEIYSSDKKKYFVVLKKIKVNEFYKDIEESRVWEVSDKVWLELSDRTKVAISNKEIREI